MTVDRAFQGAVMLLGVYCAGRAVYWLTQGEHAAAYVWAILAGMGVAAGLFMVADLSNLDLDNQIRAQEVERLP